MAVAASSTPSAARPDPDEGRGIPADARKRFELLQDCRELVVTRMCSVVADALGQPDRAAGWLGLRTFWVVEQPFDRDFFIFVHLLDAAGNTVAQRDAPPWQGRFPTSSWRPGTVVVDINDVPLPAGLPAGTYTIALGMFDPASGAHPPIALAGRPADAIPAAQVTIR